MTHRLLVRSIGNADAAVVGALRQLRPAPDAELAAILYRAPSELVSGLDVDAGTRLRDLLRQTGVEVDLVPAVEHFEPGLGEYEIALVVKRFDRIMEIVEETARITGMQVEAAMRVVWSTPAVLLGRVSAATVEALRSRYARLGVEIDASRTADARFDVAIEGGDEATSWLRRSSFAEMGVNATQTGRDSFLASDLDCVTATRLWDDLARTPTKVRVLYRDFERFDVRLDSPPTAEDAASWLSSSTGMPRTAAGAALGLTPFVLAESVLVEEMMALLEGADSRGGRATAMLVPLQTFSLSVKSGGDRDAVMTWVELIAGPEDATRFRRGARELRGPFTKTQARWLQYEFRRREISSHLVER